MDPFSIFVVGFLAGCLTGICLRLWPRDRRTSARTRAFWHPTRDSIGQ
jgi:hypothetical protein